jgi:ferredoxin
VAAENGEKVFYKRCIRSSTVKGMKHEISHKEELRELNIKARAIQVRLDSLKMRIRQIRQENPVSSQWKVFVEAKNCVGCGICQETCPVGAITIEENARVDERRCTGCGRCVQQCPEGALYLRPSGFTAKYQIRSWRSANRTSRSINHAM